MEDGVVGDSRNLTVVRGEAQRRRLPTVKTLEVDGGGGGKRSKCRRERKLSKGVGGRVGLVGDPLGSEGVSGDRVDAKGRLDRSGGGGVEGGAPPSLTSVSYITLLTVE